MRILGGVLFGALIFTTGLIAQETDDPGDFPPDVEIPGGRPGPGGMNGGGPGEMNRGPGGMNEGGPSSYRDRPRHTIRRAARQAFPGIQAQVKQFKKEVRAMGDEIRKNRMLIQSLEQELRVVEPGIARAEVRQKLNEALRREAELRLELADTAVAFTRRARDMAQKRYDEARLQLEKVKQKVKEDFPDLVRDKEAGMGSSFLSIDPLK